MLWKKHIHAVINATSCLCLPGGYELGGDKYLLSNPIPQVFRVTTNFREPCSRKGVHVSTECSLLEHYFRFVSESVLYSN